MDKHGHIYMLTDEQRAEMEAELRESIDGATAERTAELREDVARLDGYLRGRAEADAPKRGAGSNRDLAG